MLKKFGGNRMKKLLVLIFSALLLVVGCSNSEEASEESEQVEQETKNEKSDEQKQEQKQEPVQDSPDVKVDEDLTEKLEEEKAVSKGNVYEKDNVIYGTFIVNDKTDEKEVSELVDKYANELKDTHKDKKINVQAVKEGQVVQEQTIQVKEPVVENGQKLAKDLNAEVVNVIVGVYAIQVDLEEAKEIKATDKSQLVVQLSEEDTVTADYNEESKSFIGTIQGNYTKDDILNSVITVK